MKRFFIFLSVFFVFSSAVFSNEINFSDNLFEYGTDYSDVLNIMTYKGYTKYQNDNSFITFSSNDTYHCYDILQYNYMFNNDKKLIANGYSLKYRGEKIQGDFYSLINVILKQSNIYSRVNSNEQTTIYCHDISNDFSHLYYTISFSEKSKEINITMLSTSIK